MAKSPGRALPKARAEAKRAPGWGEPAPWFTVRADCNPTFNFDAVAGRPVVLFFFESSALDDSRRALEAFLARRAVFDGRRAAFLAVSVDSEDEQLHRLPPPGPAIRFLFDADRSISIRYGALDSPASGYRRRSYVLDRRLRVIDCIPFEGSAEAHVEKVFRSLGAVEAREVEPHAPVLVVPRIFDPALCTELVRSYDELGGVPSGFMREVDGRTRVVSDAKRKIRSDREIPEGSLRSTAMCAIRERLVPEIQKTFQFGVTRIERHLVACYEASAGAHFLAHRDNTTKGTAHRRFAVTINLNAGEYDGGDLRFPEFGETTYAPATGSALVFSCSLLHEVRPLMHGKRYAYLPFLYDDAAAAVREANRRFLDIG